MGQRAHERRRRLYQTVGGRGYADLVLDLRPGTGRVELIEETLSLKPYWGKPTVRNFREGAGNVGYGRTRTPLRNRKSGDRELPTYGCARLCSTRPPMSPPPCAKPVRRLTHTADGYPELQRPR